MLELKQDRLCFSFPEVHPDARCTLSLVRTLRIPDQRGRKSSSLPPGLGYFPLVEVANFKDKLSPELVARGGVALPMYQSEALWISFESSHVPDHGVKYLFAVKIAAGKRSAVTGKEWSVGLREGDYCVIPKQRWIDGFVDGNDMVRQFVAMPLGQGITVEEQITGQAEFGGLQIEVFPMKAEEFRKWYPKIERDRQMKGILRGLPAMARARRSLESVGIPATLCSTSTGQQTNTTKKLSLQSMGMAAGGAMEQQIFQDPYGLTAWDLNASNRTFVHLFNSLGWQSLTGKAPPTAPRTAKDYTDHGLPWFAYYDEGPTIGGPSDELAKVKSVGEIQEETGQQLLPDNEAGEPYVVKKIGVDPGNW